MKLFFPPCVSPSTCHQFRFFWNSKFPNFLIFYTCGHITKQMMMLTTGKISHDQRNNKKKNSRYVNTRNVDRIIVYSYFSLSIFSYSLISFKYVGIPKLLCTRLVYFLSRFESQYLLVKNTNERTKKKTEKVLHDVIGARRLFTPRRLHPVAVPWRGVYFFFFFFFPTHKIIIITIV